MPRVVKNVTWRQCTTNELLYAGLPRVSFYSQPQLERGALGSVVIAGGIEMKYL